MRPSRHYSLDPGNHPHRRIVHERMSHRVTHLTIRTAENHARFYSFFPRRWLTPYGHFEAQHYPWRWESKTEEDTAVRYRRDDGARTGAAASRTRDEFLTRSNFDRYLLEQIHDGSEGSRIRSSRAMDGARASSSAMSLDAAGELSRTDKRTPTYSHPCYLSPVRSGRYPSRAAYTCRLTLPCADTRASCKLDNLRASSQASIGRRG